MLLACIFERKNLLGGGWRGKRLLRRSAEFRSRYAIASKTKRAIFGHHAGVTFGDRRVGDDEGVVERAANQDFRAVENVGNLLVTIRRDFDEMRAGVQIFIRGQRKIGGAQEIGIEFLNRDNFWDVDWGAAEAVVWR